MGVQLISAKEILMYMNEKVLLVDMRPKNEYETFHLQGAISVPYDDDYEEWEKNLPRSDAYLLYCDRGNASLYAAKRMKETGVTIYAVAGGMEAIEKLVKR